MVRRALFVVVVLTVVVLVAAIASYAVGVGPLARPGAPRSVAFVAISRSSDEVDAREIEAVDLEAGTRQLFDAGGRITALALSADRRSLYVALDGGKIVMLDATTGTKFAEVDLRGPTVISLVPTSDARTLFAVAVTNIASSLVPIDLATRRAEDPITFTTPAGPAVLHGAALLVPLADARGAQVAFVDAAARTVSTRLVLPRGSLVPPVAFRIGEGLTGVVTFDSSGPGGLGMRVYAVSDATHWKDVRLAAPLPQGPRGAFAPGLQAAAASDGTIHACASQVSTARRYVIEPVGLQATQAGTDCGPLAGGKWVLMARRDPARLLVIGDKSGTIVRTLPLAGVPARLVH